MYKILALDDTNDHDHEAWVIDGADDHALETFIKRCITLYKRQRVIQAELLNLVTSYKALEPGERKTPQAKKAFVEAFDSLMPESIDIDDLGTWTKLESLEDFNDYECDSCVLMRQPDTDMYYDYRPTYKKRKIVD